MKVALSADPHEYIYPAKVIVVVRDSLVPLYEKRFRNLEMAVDFIREMPGKGISLTERNTKYEILVMIPLADDNLHTNPYFNRKVWGSYLVEAGQSLQDHFIDGLN